MREEERGDTLEREREREREREMRKEDDKDWRKERGRAECD